MFKKTIGILLVFTMLMSVMSINLNVTAETTRSTPYIAIGSIAVDGILDTGKYGSEIVMVTTNDNWSLGGTDPGTTASLYTAWSDGKLYFFYDVKTTKDPLITGAAAYVSDAIDLYITGPGVGNQVSLYAGTGELIYNIAGTQVGRLVTPGTGYTIELEVPWTTDPAAGSIAFAAVVNDNYKKLGTQNYISEYTTAGIATYDHIALMGKPYALIIAPFVKAGGITIDGVLDVRQYSNKIEMVSANDNWTGGGAPTDPGTTASLYTAWSDGKLFFFYDVKTTKDPLITGTAAYNSDAIDLYITGPGYGNQVSLFAGTGELIWNIVGTQVGRVVTPGVGYTVELEIPWATDPSISSIQFAAVVQDNYKKLGTKNYVNEWVDSSTYDKLIYGKSIASYTNGNVTVDGVMDSGRYGKEITMVRADDNWAGGGEATDPGTTASLYTAWNDGKLYFFYDVKTTKASLVTTPGATHSSDAIDLYLKAPVSLGGSQISVYAATGATGYIIAGTQIGRVVTAGVGYTIELEIPWATDPSISSIQFAAVVNDGYKKLGTRNYLNEWADISTYDNLLFEGKNIAPHVKPGDIAVDGILESDKYNNGISLVRADNNWTLGFADPGTTAKLYFAWADGKLYFFFDVKTTKASLEKGVATYASDAIDLYLTAPVTTGGSQISVYAGTGDIEYGITGTQIGRVVTVGVGYTIELEIPWAVDPSTQSIAFAAVVNDNCKKLGTKNYFAEWASATTYDKLIISNKTVAAYNNIGAITVDGILDTNKYGTEISMVRADNNWTLGNADPGTTAKLYTSWSAGKLYFFFDVKTTKASLVTGVAPYVSDAVELYLTAPVPLGGSQISVYAGTGDRGFDIADTQIGRVVTSGVGYTVELGIPWETDPSLGSIPFAAVVNDNCKKLGTKNYFEEWAGTSTYDNLILGLYKVANTDKLISNIAPNTTVAKFKASTLSLTASSFVLKDKSGNGNILADIDKVTTGTIVEITNGPTTETYKIVIFGDVNGNGNIELTDMADIKLHILKSTQLAGDYFSAGDISSKGSVTISDLLAVKKSILGIATINQNIYPLKKIS